MQDKEIEMLLRLVEAQVSLTLCKQNLYKADGVESMSICRHQIEMAQNTVNRCASCLRTEVEPTKEEVE